MDALSDTLSNDTEDDSDADVDALSGKLSRKRKDHYDADERGWIHAYGTMLNKNDNTVAQGMKTPRALPSKMEHEYVALGERRMKTELTMIRKRECACVARKEQLFEIKVPIIRDAERAYVALEEQWMRNELKIRRERERAYVARKEGWIHAYCTVLNKSDDTVAQRMKTPSTLPSKMEHEYVALVDAFFRKMRKNTEDHSDAEGYHECEVFMCGHEAEESEHNWNTCTKNPGHHNFIPAPEFHLDHLPEWARHPLVLECVELVSTLTVRLRVTFISLERPEGYTFHNHKGSHWPRVASGFIQNVYPGRGPCPCRNCKDSPTPAQQWFWVYVETACHVVYDTNEAQFTEVNVFYDDENSQTSGRMKTILALDTIIEGHDGDFCALGCATHDEKLCRKILQNQVRLDKIRNWNQLREGELYDHANCLCVIVSHPHGRAKTITVGEIERFIRCEALIQVMYTTDTCSGSSGAPVLVFDFRKGDNSTFFSKGRGPHSETVCVEGKTLNMSAEFLTSRSTDTLNFLAKQIRIVF